MTFLGMLFILFSSVPAHAAISSTLEVGEVRTIGKEVVLPVTLHKTNYLTSLQATINIQQMMGRLRSKASSQMVFLMVLHLIRLAKLKTIS